MKEIKISGLIKRKIRKNDIPLIVDYVKKETVIFPIGKELKERWRISKKFTIFYLFFWPLNTAIWALYARLKEYPSLLDYFKGTFQKSNKEIEGKLAKLTNKGEKRFYLLLKELNNVGIEAVAKISYCERVQHDAQICKRKFLQNPNSLTFRTLLNCMDDLNLARKSAMNVFLRKLKKEKGLVSHYNSLSHLDDRDIQDMKRALLTDAFVSSTVRKVLPIATPIELCLKSNKLIEKGEISFLDQAGGALHVRSILMKNRQKDYLIWINSILHSIESR